MYPLVVADIGGTNARFALATRVESGRTVLEEKKRFKCENFDSFETLLSTYLGGLDGASPRRACIAVAGPVRSDDIEITNLRWRFSVADMARRLSLRTLVLVNDFAALAYALPELEACDYSPIYSGTAVADSAPVAVIGAGTGFGVAGLRPGNDRWIVVDGEGGHASFSPASNKEWQIAQRIRGHSGHVSIEQILSGPGLVSLYLIISEVNGESPRAYEPAQITQLALAGEDANCVEAVDSFCAILGDVAGDVALTLGAHGGVYIGGGIASEIEPFLHAGEFCRRFLDKGAMSGYVEKVPVRLIKNDDVTLIGAAAWIGDQREHENEEPLKTAVDARHL